MRGQGEAWSLVCELWAPGVPQFHLSLPMACGALPRVTDQHPSCSWEQNMESDYKNEEATEGWLKLLTMNGARTKRYKYLLRLGLSTEEAIEQSQYPINHRAIETMSSTLNEQSRLPLHQEEHHSDMPSHPVCKLSYHELKNMSKVLPNTKLRSRFYYQTRVRGVDPDESSKALLADPSVQEFPDDDELVGHEIGRSLYDKATRPSTSRQHNTPSSHLTTSKGSSRLTSEGGSFTQQCELIRSNISSFGTGSLCLASSSGLIRDSDRLPFNMEDPYYGGDQPPRHDRPYSGSEQDQEDFQDLHTGYPSRYGFASASQAAWNEDNFPPAQTHTEQIAMEDLYDDKYDSPRGDRSHFGSEFDREDFRINYDPPRYDKSYPDMELGRKDGDRDPPRWDSAHPDWELSQSGSYDPPRYDRSHGSELNQNDLVDVYGPPRYERSHPGFHAGTEQDWVYFRERYDPVSRDRSHDGSAEDRKNFRDGSNYDPPRPERFHAGSGQDQKDFRDRYDPPRQDRSHVGSAENRKNWSRRYGSPRRDSFRRGSDLDHEDEYDPRRHPRRSRRGSESDRKGSRERYDPPRCDRSRRGSEAGRKDSRDKRYDCARRDRSHHRSEPDRKGSRASPTEPRPPEDPQSSNSLKKEYESFLRNLNWSPPPQITTATETTDYQPGPSTRKRKLSTQVAPPSVFVLGDLLPLVTPSIVPGLPIKRPCLDQDAINRGISSLMDPSRWAAPDEGTPEEVQAWKQDYHRFLSDESWKQDYRRVLENISKTGTTSKANHGQASGINSSDQSKEVHQPELGPSDTQEGKENDESTQPITGSTQEPPTYCNQAERRSPGSRKETDRIKKTLGSRKDRNHRYQVKRMLRNTRQDDQAHLKSPITAVPTKNQANLPHRNSKDLGSNRQLQSGSSTSRMALPKISTAEETKDPSALVFIVPTNFPMERLSAQQMDAVESNILEAILESNDERMKPSFQKSFRRNGKYGVLCNDRFSNDWLHKHIHMNEPWPNASLQIVTADSTKVRVSVKLPLCKNDDNDRILKFIIKQNAHLDAKDWTVFHRFDSDTSTSVMFLVDEDSVGNIRNCGKINFKMGRVDVVIEGDSEVEPGLSGDDRGTGLSSGASRGESAPSNSKERNTVNTGPGGPSGMSGPLQLPSVRSPRKQHSRLPELPGRRDRPPLLNPYRDQPVFGGPNQPQFEERSGLFIPSLYDLNSNPYGEQRPYVEASLKTLPFPSLHESTQQIFNAPPSTFLEDAVVTRSRVPFGPSSSRSGRHGAEQGTSRRNIRSRSPSDRDSNHPTARADLSEFPPQAESS